MGFERTFHSECKSGDCGVGFAGREAICSDDGGCYAAILVNGCESDHHDEILINATAAIQAVLKMIPEDPTGKGRNPAFIQTNHGLLLSWVSHSEVLPKDAVTRDNPEEFEKALCLDLDKPEQTTY